MIEYSEWVLGFISDKALLTQGSSGSAIERILSISGSSSAGYRALISSLMEFKSANEDSSEFRSAKEFSTLLIYFFSSLYCFSIISLDSFKSAKELSSWLTFDLSLISCFSSPYSWGF